MLDTISPRAQKLLQNSVRLYKPESIVAVEQKIAAHVEPHKAFVNFEYYFGGYVIEGQDQWKLRLMPYDNFAVNSVLFVECAAHRVAQFSFHINEAGTIYATEYQDVFPLASSIEVFIEREAIYYELRQKPKCCRFISSSELDESQLADFQAIDEASDRYETWWASKNQDLFITKHRMWSIKATPRFCVYGQTEDRVRSFATQLEPNLSLYKIWNWP